VQHDLATSMSGRVTHPSMIPFHTLTIVKLYIHSAEINSDFRPISPTRCGEQVDLFRQIGHLATSSQRISWESNGAWGSDEGSPARQEPLREG
jgi:hypothetical protein